MTNIVQVMRMFCSVVRTSKPVTLQYSGPGGRMGETGNYVEFW
jgi:hypothetical protein